MHHFYWPASKIYINFGEYCQWECGSGTRKNMREWWKRKISPFLLHSFLCFSFPFSCIPCGFTASLSILVCFTLFTTQKWSACLQATYKKLGKLYLMINDNSNIESFFLMFLKYLCACCDIPQDCYRKLFLGASKLVSMRKHGKALSQNLNLILMNKNNRFCSLE